MKASSLFGVRILMISACFSLTVMAQSNPPQGRPVRGHVMVPASSVENPEDVGVKMHTPLRIFVPSAGMFGPKATQPAELPPFPGFFFETPASLACIYQLTNQLTPGCNPNQTVSNPTGGQGTIAIVDAFDDPTAAADLATFSTQFGLPPANFTTVFATGANPGVDPTGGSEVEESLDIEWAHAMAPNAKIVLVEIPSLSLNDISTGVSVASKLVAAAGGGIVSMSFGGGEFQQERNFDGLFTTPGVVYIASSGDSPGPEWPSVSPNVIAAGGTSISRDQTTGAFLIENTWQDAGGGLSELEPRPAFQNVIQFLVGAHRGVPDISFDANPATGVWVFDGNPLEGIRGPAGWLVVGGTSVSAPSLAGIISAAGKHSTSSQAENTLIYGSLPFGRGFRDIIFGDCGLNIGNFSGGGWDFCSGVGTAQGLAGK